MRSQAVRSLAHNFFRGLLIGLFHLKTGDEILKQPYPRWLISGVVQQRSLAVVYGASNVGKSFLALDMALSLARGIDWFGTPLARAWVVSVALHK